MKSMSYFLMVCCLLMLGCSKDNNTPEGKEETNGKGTYLEATIGGPVVRGDFKWDGSNILLAMEEHDDGIARAGIAFGHPLGQVRTLWGGITIPPGTGTYKVTPNEDDVPHFELIANGVAFIQQDMAVKVTDYKVVEGSGKLRLIERIYGTFEGTVQTLAQTEDQESGLVHTVKGKFGYNRMD